MQTPDSNPRITLTPAARRWRARLHGHVFADTDDAIVLHEKGLAPVVYFPRQDVAMEYMGRTHHHTFCPHKGKAAYYTLSMDGDIYENVAWTYEDPYDPVGPIRDRIAFYPGDIDLYEVDDAVVNPHIQATSATLRRGSGSRSRARATRSRAIHVVSVWPFSRWNFRDR